jgi:SAM-dependent methyltransferase
MRRFASEMKDVGAGLQRAADRAGVERAIAEVLAAASELERSEPRAAVLEAQEAFRAELWPILGETEIMQRSIAKPRGYAGDHLLIDAFYTGRAAQGAVGRLLDEMVLGCAAGRAVVERKRFVARWLEERLRHQPKALVADIACGPCRLEREVLDSGAAARFVSLDSDEGALAYARAVVGAGAPVELWHENALRVARDPGAAEPMRGADLVVSLGLFDYLPARIAARLLAALRRAARPGAELLIGNFAADNPSRTFMEWFGDWHLIHRTEDEFLAIFRDAGFSAPELTVEREAAGGCVLLVTARAGEEERTAVRGRRGAAAAA